MTFSDDGVLLTKFDRMYDNVRPGNGINNCEISIRKRTLDFYS